jgi:hypothetical protein
MMEHTVTARISAALRLRPMTVAELVPAVCSTDTHVRACLAALRETGRVRPGGMAPRKHRQGAAPRYWEAA